MHLSIITIDTSLNFVLLSNRALKLRSDKSNHYRPISWECNTPYDPRNKLTAKLSTVICSTTAFFYQGVKPMGTPPACKEIFYLQSLSRVKSVQVNKTSCITCCLMYIAEEAKKNTGNKLGILGILKWLTWALSRHGAVNTIPLFSLLFSTAHSFPLLLPSLSLSHHDCLLFLFPSFHFFFFFSFCQLPALVGNK